ITALTFTVTLSRVTTSCDGTSRVSIRRETRTMRSMGANTRMMPGPFGCGSTRPSREITPRSYSRRILIEVSRYSTTMITPTVVKSSITASLLIRNGFYHEFQFVDGLNLDAHPGGHRPGRHRVPILAVDKDFALRRQVGNSGADLAHPARRTGLHLKAPRAHNERKQQNGDEGEGQRQSDGGAPMDAHFGERTVDER